MSPNRAIRPISRRAMSSRALPADFIHTNAPTRRTAPSIRRLLSRAAQAAQAAQRSNHHTRRSRTHHRKTHTAHIKAIPQTPRAALISRINNTTQLHRRLKKKGKTQGINPRAHRLLPCLRNNIGRCRFGGCYVRRQISFIINIKRNGQLKQHRHQC